MTTDAPSAEVVAAFGGDAAGLDKLAGGQGDAWRAGDVVLKPDGEPEVTAWLAETVEPAATSDAFRLASHVRSTTGAWVVDGWAATQWVDGAPGSGRWDDVLEVSDAFHAAIEAGAAARRRSPPARHAVGDRRPGRVA